MRKLIGSTYATLDGRVDDVQHWTIPYDSESAVEYHDDLLKDADGLLLGRRTYEIFSAIWPVRAGELAYVDRMNAMTKHVASTTLTDLEWENSRLIEGDVAEEVAELKRGPGQDLVVYGGRDLVATLLEHRLVDEYRVLVHPVLLRTGRTILPDGGDRLNLRLVDTTVIAPGVAVLVYRPAG